MTRRDRRRVRIAVVVTICLLIQQIALAAYACTMTIAPIDSVATTEKCAAMEKEQPPTTLCQKHCSPDPTFEVHHNFPSVPALALPPVTFGAVISQISTGESVASDDSFLRSHPPPRLRYCRLLI